MFKDRCVFLGLSVAMFLWVMTRCSVWWWWCSGGGGLRGEGWTSTFVRFICDLLQGEVAFGDGFGGK
jgi:hypothetical protein